MFLYTFLLAMFGLISIVISSAAIIISLLYSPNPSEGRPASKPFNMGTPKAYSKFYYPDGATVKNFLDEINKDSGTIENIYENTENLIENTNEYFTYIGETPIIFEFQVVVNSKKKLTFKDVFMQIINNNKIITTYSTNILNDTTNITKGFISLSKNDTLRFKFKNIENNNDVEFELLQGSYYQLSTINNSNFP